MEQVREEFEAWFKTTPWYGSDVRAVERVAWDSWLASRALIAARLNEKSWEGQVDRQGGSFSEDEIEYARRWV